MVNKVNTVFSKEKDCIFPHEAVDSSNPAVENATQYGIEESTPQKMWLSGFY